VKYIEFHTMWCFKEFSGKIPDMTHLSANKLREELRMEIAEKHGQIIGGTALAALLGYKTADAFRKAASSQKLSLKTFTVPGRHGRYALSREVADWLIELRFNEIQIVQDTSYPGNSPKLSSSK
jgi:hypothetical protein